MTLLEYRTWRETKNTGTPRLSIIVPTYNEELRVVPTIGAVAAFVSTQGYEWELVVSDDGSSDSTLEQVRGLGLANLKIVEAEQNTGKGGAVARGVSVADGALVLFLDADQSTPIEQLPQFMDALSDDKYSIAIGSRKVSGAKVQNKSGFRNLLSNGLNAIVSTVFQLPYADTQCGFKLFNGDVAREMFSKGHIEGFSFDLELLYIAKVNDLRVCELPVEWHDAPDSKVSGGKVALRFLADMPKILTNRLKGEYKLEVVR